jgi:hypothetical protein
LPSSNEPMAMVIVVFLDSFDSLLGCGRGCFLMT